MTKPIPIQMKVEAHHELRLMSAALGTSMGDLILLMVKSLRERLERCRRNYKIRIPYTIVDAQMINLLFQKDFGQISQAEFEAGMRDLKSNEPSPLNLGGGKRAPKPGEGIRDRKKPAERKNQLGRGVGNKSF